MMGNAGVRKGLPRMGAARTKFRGGMAAALVSMALAGCSSTKKDVAPVDPNLYPANYRIQITEFLRQSLTTRADFRGALISPPVLKPIGDSQRYMVCLQFNGNSQIKTKVAIYFGGLLTQFIDATPDQCGDAAYQPFKELSGALPPS
jgi:hypothetical protein